MPRVPLVPIIAPISPWMRRSALSDPVNSPRAAAALSTVLLSRIAMRCSSVRRTLSLFAAGAAGVAADCANDAVDQQDAAAASASAIGKARRGGVTWIIPLYRPDQPDRQMNGKRGSGRYRSFHCPHLAGSARLWRTQRKHVLQMRRRVADVRAIARGPRQRPMRGE